MELYSKSTAGTLLDAIMTYSGAINNEYFNIALQELNTEITSRINNFTEIANLIKLEANTRFVADDNEIQNRNKLITYIVSKIDNSKFSILNKLKIPGISGSNTGDETYETIIEKIGFIPVNSPDKFASIDSTNTKLGSFNISLFTGNIYTTGDTIVLSTGSWIVIDKLEFTFNTNIVNTDYLYLLQRIA